MQIRWVTNASGAPDVRELCMGMVMARSGALWAVQLVGLTNDSTHQSIRD